MAIDDSLHSLATSVGGFGGHILGIDPGERTGWAWMHDYQLIDCGEIPTGNVPIAYNNLYQLFTSIVNRAHIVQPIKQQPFHKQLHIAIEDYRVYSWKAQDHSWSNIHTIKVVGFAELNALAIGAPYILRLAQHAKISVTDERLIKWGMWARGQRHARDAIRHAGLYAIDYTNNMAR